MHMDSERESFIQLLEFTPGMRRRVETAIAGLVDLLDALEAPAEDLEDGHDAELDHEGEETLGWAAGMSQVKLGVNTADGDNTAPETHGKGFRRCGPDDFEPDNEGDELDPGEGPDDNGIADQDGANEQWALVWGGAVV